MTSFQTLLHRFYEQPFNSSQSLFLQRISYVFAFTLAVYGSLHIYIFGKPGIGSFELIISLALLGNTVLLNKTKKLDRAQVILLVIGIVLMGFLFVHGGLGKNGYIWFFIFPPVAYYLARARRGVISVIILFSVVIVLFLLHVFGIISLPYATAEMQFAFFSLLIASIIDYSIAREREQDKAVIEQARAKDEALLGSIGEGMIVTSTSGAIVRVNNQALKLLGFRDGDLIGKDLYDMVKLVDGSHSFITREKQPPFLAMLHMKTIIWKLQDIFMQRKDGSRFPVSLTSAPVRLNSVPIGAITVFHDVSREHEIDQAKSEFVSFASHQLRTPVTVIRGYSDMLLSGDAGLLSDTQKTFVKKIASSVILMNDLIDEFLNVARIELGLFTSKIERVSVLKLIDDVAANLEQSFLDNKLVLTKSIPHDLPYLSTDQKLLYSVIQNLITNSIKYTSEHGVIKISAREESSSILISVADSGIGISKSEQSKIFSKLYRGENAQKLTGGTGLGLYICKIIIEYLGGSIWFTSSKDKGTTFFVRHPLVQSGVRTIGSHENQIHAYP